MGHLCGVDEAGRGPVMGPLVVACVRVPDDLELVTIGVKDSKVLSPIRREELYGKILDVAEVSTEVIEAVDIDILMKSMNLNRIEERAFNKVLSNIAKDGDHIFLDSADVDPERFGRNVTSDLKFRTEVTSAHGADAKYPVVSAASIVAKVERDGRIREIAEELYRELPADMGSGYPSDPRTVEFIEKWIKRKGDTPPHTRKSWDTARRLMAKHANRSLDDFGGKGGR